MAQPYIGEIRMFAGNFAPSGWLFCDGSMLPISEYDTLFSLIGTTYGGDGQNTFGLPDLRGRIPIHMGTGAGVSYTIGEWSGAETMTLTTQQIPAHTHLILATDTVADTRNPKGARFARVRREPVYAPLTGGSTAMHAQSISAIGGSQPHNNMQPFLCINFIISLYGIFPSQS